MAKQTITSNELYEDQRFFRVKLDDVALDGVRFESCTFAQCVFKEMLFRSCRFVDCVFEECELTLSRFRYCTMQTVHFKATKCVGIDWSDIAGSGLATGSPFSFEECTLTHATFLGMQLQRLEITDCRVHEGDFRQANLTGADFGRTDLRATLFHETDLSKADLRSAKNYAIDVTANTIKKTKFAMPEALALLHMLDIELDK